MAKERGFGTVLQRGQYFTLKYSNGKTGPQWKMIVESTRITDRNEAMQLLAKRNMEIAAGKIQKPEVRKVRMSELFHDLILDYKKVNNRSIEELERRIKTYLDPMLGNFKATEVTAPVITNYVNQRIEQKSERTGKAPAHATINRELATISRAFTLALKETGKYEGSVPYIKMLPEDNARQGFLKPAQLETLCQHLPEEVEPVVRFLYITGWRKQDALDLEWKDVDLDSMQLTGWDSKSNQPRNVAIDEECFELLQKQREKTPPLCPYVFHREGYPILDFRHCWRVATKKAGLAGLLVHDLRRSAVKNWIDGGVPEKVAMQLVGHKTASMLWRYFIVNLEQQAEAVQKGLARRNKLRTRVV